MRKVTIAIKFEDMGWKIDTYITTICDELKFRKVWLKKYEGNGVETIQILEWEKITNLREIGDSVNSTVISED